MRSEKRPFGAAIADRRECSRWRIGLGAVSVLCALSMSTFAVDPAAQVITIAERPRPGPGGMRLAYWIVQVTMVDGKTVIGTWVEANEDGSLRLTEGAKEFSVKAAEVMTVAWPASAASGPSTTAPAGSHASTMPADGGDLVAYLKDGSRLPCHIRGGGPDGLELEFASADRMKLPLSALAGMRYPGMSNDEAAQAFDKALGQPDASQDTLFILGANNKMQTLRGTLESLDAKGGSFRWRDRSVPFTAQKTYGLVMAAGVERAVKAPVRCLLDDGSILCGRIAGSEAETLRMVIGGNRVVAVHLSRLVEMEFRSDRLTFLNDIEPAGYSFEPFGVTRWPYRYNRSVANRELHMDGWRYLRGIGMHSQAVLSYELKAGYDQLAATIGIDDGARPLGNAIFSVLADGKEVYRSEPVTGRDSPRAILVPIRGAKRLELRVDFGDEQDIGDQADWCDARLIK